LVQQSSLLEEIGSDHQQYRLTRHYENCTSVFWYLEEGENGLGVPCQLKLDRQEILIHQIQQIVTTVLMVMRAPNFKKTKNAIALGADSDRIVDAIQNQSAIAPKEQRWRDRAFHT
jgi:hypothetical protein